MNRRDTVLALATGAAAAAAPAAFAKVSVPAPDITAEITAVLNRTAELWDAQDTAGLRDLWDRDDPEPYYLAGEQDNWFIGWPAINAYLAPPGRTVAEGYRVRFYDIKARLLAPDLAFAAYWMHTDMKIVFSPKPFASDNRVSAVFRRKDGAWRYLCYAEAFQSPTMVFQKMIEKEVEPGYTEFLESVKAKKKKP